MHDFVFYNHHLHNQFLCLEKEALSLLRDCTLPALRNFKAFITLWSSLIEELSFPSYFLISEVLISWVQGTLHKIVLKDEVYCCNHESPLARHKMLRFLQGHPDPTSFQKSPHPHSHVSLGYGILNYHNLFFFFFPLLLLLKSGWVQVRSSAEGKSIEASGRCDIGAGATGGIKQVASDRQFECL